MTDNVDSLPVIRDNSGRVRRERITDSVITPFFCLLISLFILSFFDTHFEYPIKLIGYMLAITPLLALVPYFLLRKRSAIDTLVIDEVGIHISRRGVMTNYEWSDVASVTMVPVETPARAPPRFALKINRKGIVYIADDGSDQIGDEFGFDLDNIQNIINICITKWGCKPNST